MLLLADVHLPWGWNSWDQLCHLHPSAAAMPGRRAGLDTAVDDGQSNRPNRPNRPKARLGVAGFAHLSQFLLQVAHFVAEAGSQFEVEVGGGAVHLGRELLNEIHQLLGRA